MFKGKENGIQNILSKYSQQVPGGQCSYISVKLYRRRN